MDPTEIVITGVGVVSPIGVGKQAFWDSLMGCRSGVAVHDDFADSDFRYRIAAAVRDFDPKQYVKPRKSLKVMSREIQLGFAAAAMAMEDASLAMGGYDPDRLGVVFGGELLNSEPEDLEDAYRHCLVDGKFQAEQWGDNAMSHVFPLWMLKYLPNMAACHIGIAHDARGPNNTITLEEASSLSAIIEGADLIRRGWADVVIVGGTGSRLVLTDMVFHGDEELSRRIDQPAAASRPFDAGRDGMVNGEGAGAFVIESRQHADRRGATIMARLAGSARGFDSGANGQQGIALRNCLRGALAAAELQATDIGHVNAEGRSTIHDDCLEAQAIRDVLGNVPVTAPKSFFGYLGAGAGAVELAASVLSFAQGEVPVTLNYETPDPNCPVNVIHGQPLRNAPPTALALSRAVMGQVAAVVVAAP